jgi:hypothetical protein
MIPMVVVVYLRSAQGLQVMLSAQNVVRKFIEWTQLMFRKNVETPGTEEFVQLDKDIYTIQNFLVRAVGQDTNQELVRYHNNRQIFRMDQPTQQQGLPTQLPRHMLNNRPHLADYTPT